MRILQLLARAFDRLLSWLPALILGALARLGYAPPLRIVAYDGYATDDVALVRGRVLADQSEEATSGPGRVLTLLQRSEIPRATVQVTLEGRSCTVQADSQGFFHVELPLPTPLPAGWHSFGVELVGGPVPPSGPARAEARVLVPSDAATLAVVSDVDDTVIRSHSAKGARMAVEVLSNRPAEREVVAEMASLYRALEQGSEGATPFFYHSSAGWNTYEHLRDIFQGEQVPLGPMFLRAYSAERMLTEGDVGHKLDAIREVMDRFPELPVLLVGDAAGVDPEVYREVAREQPHRIAAVYLLRTEAAASRLWDVESIADDIRAAGVEVLLVDSPRQLAGHARDRGWIRAEEVGGWSGRLEGTV